MYMYINVSFNRSLKNKILIMFTNIRRIFNTNANLFNYVVYIDKSYFPMLQTRGFYLPELIW